MRDIHFRAKYLDSNDFIYGYYVYISNNVFPYKIIDNKGLSLDVDGKTIGQYTGLKDKNGKEIYEGDIVEWAGYKMEIFWGEDIGFGYGFCWRPCGDNSDYHESMTGFIDEYEVIGNIYDNPELLEVDK